ncbi:MAG: hypothetical protein RLZ53_461 [Actinomycetota bacterium]
MFKKIAGWLSLATLFACMTSYVPASAGETEKLVDFSSAIEAVAPQALTGLSDVVPQKQIDGSIVATVNDIEVELPASNTDALTYTTDTNFRISIGLPKEGAGISAELDSEGRVTYTDLTNSTSPLIKEDGSVAITTVAASREAPTSYMYPISGPEGTSLLLLDDGSIQILDSFGEVAAMIAKPWALDAAGNAVETHFTLFGMNVIQVVEHDKTGVVYPVVFDPWLGQYLISYIVWDFSAAALAAYGPTLKVYPTEFGRYTGILARDAAWLEVLKLAGSRANKQNLIDQFMCHWDYVRIKEPRKASWNLDSARPNVGFWPTVWADCNPK